MSLVLAFFGFGIQATYAQEAPMLRLEKIASSNFANPDSVIDYTVNVTNTSSVTMSNLTITEIWPTQFTLNGQPNGFVTWTIDSLEPGATRSSILKVTIPSGLPAGTYESKTTVSGQNPPVQEVRNDTLEIRSVAVLSSQLPTTGGDYLSLITLVLIIQCSLIAAYNFQRYFSHHV